MKMTSAQLNKRIRTLEDRKMVILADENNNSKYVLAKGESEEIPAYDLKKTDDELMDLDHQVGQLRHALNVFNTVTKLPCGVTIDQALVEMAQLTRQLTRLDSMRKGKKVVRLNMNQASQRNVPEFEYLNFEPKDAEALYEKYMERVQQLQLELDKLNQTVELEVK